MNPPSHPNCRCTLLPVAYKYSRVLALVFVALLVATFVTRLGVKTHVDISPTSLQKDFAHFVVAAAITWGWTRRCWGVVVIAIVVSLFELFYTTMQLHIGNGIVTNF